MTSLASARTATPAIAASPAVRPLVDARWLKAHLGQPGLIVLDVRQAAPRGPADVFGAGHVPGAVHTDFTDWRVTTDGVPNMLPPIAALERLIGSLGIGNGDHVVIVASGQCAADLANATRIHWTFKVLGHDRVSVLDGGWAAWAADAGNPVATERTPHVVKPFTAAVRPELVATLDGVRAKVMAGARTLIDVRSSDQHLGFARTAQVAASGTLPRAVNLEPDALYDPVAKRFALPDEIREEAETASVPLEGDLTVFCNTGHLATLGWFALSELLGNPTVALYDGSMAEWTADPLRPLDNAPTPALPTWTP
ncbi:MAG TPA: rhodanese-like domain-containing protein [Azospirillum sp.]|nr:rhodanese-like domain-containing protein [Azospirillum sp.]